MRQPPWPHVGAVEQDMQAGGGLQIMGKLKCCRIRHLFVTNNGLSGTTTVALPQEQQGKILQAKREIGLDRELMLLARFRLVSLMLFQ